MTKFGGTKVVWRARARLTAAVGTLALLSTMVVVAPYSIEAQAASVGTGTAPTGFGERHADAGPADAGKPALALVDDTDVYGFAATAAQQDDESATSTTSADVTASPADSGNTGDTSVESVPAIDPSIPTADLTISITPELDALLSESFLTFTVDVANAGPAEAVNIVATAALPDFMSFIALSGCWLANDTFPECHLNEIPAGESRSFEILVLVGPGASGPQTTAVSVTSETVDRDPTNNTATADNTVNTRATWRDISATSDVSIAKIDLVDPVPALGTITYSITVANAGPNAAVDTVVTETLPSGVTLVSTSGCRKNTGVPTCDLGTIPPRQTRTFEVVVSANPGTTGDITNAVSVATRSNDTNGSNNTATETTTVNSEPIAVDDTVMIDENASATVLDLTGNDTDFDNDVLTITAIDDTGAVGVVSLVGGVVTYDPNGQFDALAFGDTATDTFTYDISDGNGGNDSANVTVTINGVNEPPVAVDDSATVGEDDSAAAIDVATNDTDTNGDALTPTAVDTTGTAGLASVAAGVVSYSPNGAFEALNIGDTGTDTFGYTIDDGNGGTDTGTVSVTVTGVNDAPTITAPATVSVPENTTAVIDANATDPEGETEGGGGLTYSLSGTDAGAFTINATTGVLTFTTAPDFDIPGDNNGDNDYLVTVTVTDSGLLTDTQDIIVSVTNGNEAPSILAPSAGSVNENVALSSDVIDSSDPDGETDNGGGLVYSVTGPDAAEFSIGATGVLNFAAHDFETPTDVGANNTYNVTFVVTDAAGLTDTQDFAYTVTNVNEAPTITAPATVSVPENTTAVTDANATDPEGETEGGGGLTYSLSGPDSGAFTMNAAGNLAFNPAPDFEAPTDVGGTAGDNIYLVTITVTDTGGLTEAQDITVTVTNGNEVPMITSNGGGATAAIIVAENTTATLTDVEATDDDGETENGGGLVYALSGADAGLFSITQLGILTFVTAPDFDIPGDANGDNDYEVTVTVGDVALATDSQAITVTVTNLNEAPVITTNGGGATAVVSVPENTTLVTNVDATDPDGETENDTPPDGLKYSLSGPDNALFSIDNDGVLAFINPPDFENPLDVGGDNIYNITVFVTDQNGAGLADSQTFTITVADQPDPPLITSDGGGNTATVNVAEGTTAVTDVDATDQEGATEGAGLTYALTGADAGTFTFNGATGVLAFAAAPDFEIPGSNSGDNNYQVTVTVTDPQALTDSQDITITVTNVNEAPTITAAATAMVAENSTGTIIDVDATDPEGETEGGGGLVYSLSGPDGLLFSIDANGNVAFISPPSFETPGDAGGNNTYDVTVTVTDLSGAGLADSQSIAISVTDVAEPPFITSDGGGDTAAVTATQGNTAVTDVDASDDDGGILTYSISGGPDAALFTINAGSGVLTFVTAPATDGVHDVTVTVTDPQALTDSQAITVTVPANTAPTAVDDAYSGVPVNTELRAGLAASGNPNVAFADGVLTNGTDDSDPESNPLTVTAIVGCGGDGLTGCATTGGGTVTMNADGTFSYVSQVGETATSDTFQYTLSDGSLTDTGLVTIGLFPTIWFIDNAAGGTGGSGTSNDPFRRTTDFNNATTSTGDRVYLAGGTYTDGVTLLPSQNLYGEGVAFSSGFLTLPAGTVPTITTPSGNGITLASGNTVRGLDIGNTAGHAISGSAVGTPLIDSVNVTGSGGIISIAGGNLSNVVLGTQTSSSSGGTAAIDLSGLTGAYVGGSPSITSSSGTGIRLLNNSGASISFAGVSVNNSATNQPGIVGSGGGTLQISGPGGGTVNAGSATAVQISDMSLGVVLTRVDSVGGATPGISLTNTTGFFTVAGSSNGCQSNAASCSGGAIAGKTGNTDGVLLNNVVMVTLNDMNISNNSGNGIQATNVTGFVIDDSRLDGNADSIAQFEAALKFTNLSGTATISNTTVSNTFADSVMLDNTSGTVTVNLTNSTIAPNNASSGDNGVQLVSTGSATLNVNVDGSSFTGARSIMLFVDVGGTGGGTVNVGASTGNTFTQGQTNLSSGGAIEVSASGSSNFATVAMNIRNNTILAGSNTFEGDIIVVGNGFGFAGSTNVTLDNNQVGTSGANGSATNPAGGQGDGGIVVTQNGTGTMNALLNNNRIFDYNDRGIEIFYDAEGPSDPTGGTLNITITGNTIADAGAENHALQFTGGDFVNSCMQVANNTLTSAGDEIRVDVFGEPGVAFNVVGLAAPFTEANIAALWTGANTLGGAAPNVQVYSLAPSTIGGAGSCPQP